MSSRSMIRAAIVVTTIGCLESCAASARSSDVSRADGDVSMQQVARKPKSLPVDPEFHVGRKNDTEVTKWIKSLDLNNDFRKAVPFVMKSSNGNDACELSMRIAKGSFDIERIKDTGNRNGFIIGIITNPKDCRPLAFTLDPNDIVVWYGRYTSPTLSGGPNVPIEGVGRTGMIRLQRDGATTEDEWFPKDIQWTMGYCNHQSQGTTDQALVLAYAERCSGPPRYEHNAESMAAAMLAAARSKDTDVIRLLPGAKDLALWFACGGDCCYSSFEQ